MRWLDLGRSSINRAFLPDLIGLKRSKLLCYLPVMWKLLRCLGSYRVEFFCLSLAMHGFIGWNNTRGQFFGRFYAFSSKFTRFWLRFIGFIWGLICNRLSIFLILILFCRPLGFFSLFLPFFLIIFNFFIPLFSLFSLNNVT